MSFAIALETAIVRWIPERERLRARKRRLQVSRPLLLLASLGVVAWVVYAVRMYALSRQKRWDTDVTLDIDHCSVQGALGLALAALAILTAVCPGGCRFIACCIGVVAAYLGLVSFAGPDAAGGFGQAWSAAAMAWGMARRSCALQGDRRRTCQPRLSVEREEETGESRARRPDGRLRLRSIIPNWPVWACLRLGALEEIFPARE